MKKMLTLVLYVSMVSTCNMSYGMSDYESVSKKAFDQARRYFFLRPLAVFIDFCQSDNFKDFLLREGEDVSQLTLATKKLMKKTDIAVWWWDEISTEIFTIEKIDQSPEEFLKYLRRIYVRDDEGKFSLSDLRTNRELLGRCKQVRIEDFSAIGAAMVSRRMRDSQMPFAYFFTPAFEHVDRKVNLVQELIDLGFVPTERDMEYATEEFCIRCIKLNEKKLLLYLGHNDPNSFLSRLSLHDIKSIARRLTPPLIPNPRLIYLSSKLVPRHLLQS